MTKLVEKHKAKLGKLEEKILESYNPSVLIDECQAYLSSSHDYVQKKTDIEQGVMDEFAALKQVYR